MRVVRLSSCVVAAVLVTWVLAASALAAFPGRNGELAVQLLQGGVVEMSANGSDVHPICVNGASCRAEADPTWSPDGRELLVADPDLKIAYPDGSCLDCALGQAGAPAWKADGSQISFVTHGQVEVDGLDGIRDRSPALRASAAVWSSAGKLAVVRDGAVWAGAVGRLAKLWPALTRTWTALRSAACC